MAIRKVACSMRPSTGCCSPQLRGGLSGGCLRRPSAQDTLLHGAHIAGLAQGRLVAHPQALPRALQLLGILQIYVKPKVQELGGGLQAYNLRSKRSPSQLRIGKDLQASHLSTTKQGRMRRVACLQGLGALQQELAGALCPDGAQAGHG